MTLWAFDIKLWLKGQNYVDHLFQTTTFINENDRFCWAQVDTQLYNFLKSTINTSHRQKFHTHATCFRVWKRLDYCTQMALNAFMVFVKIS